MSDVLSLDEEYRISTAVSSDEAEAILIELLNSTHREDWSRRCVLLGNLLITYCKTTNTPKANATVSLIEELAPHTYVDYFRIVRLHYDTFKDYSFALKLISRSREYIQSYKPVVYSSIVQLVELDSLELLILGQYAPTSPRVEELKIARFVTIVSGGFSSQYLLDALTKLVDCEQADWMVGELLKRIWGNLQIDKRFNGAGANIDDRIASIETFINALPAFSPIEIAKYLGKIHS